MGTRSLFAENVRSQISPQEHSLETSPFDSLAGCRSDEECPLTEACYNRECQDACLHEQCGTNAVCKARNHRGYCQCPEHYRGNPYVSCRRPECTSNPECPDTLKCENEKCVDPCACAANAKCERRNHQGICTCLPGFIGDPYHDGCYEREPVVEESRCYTDGECPSKEACFDGECVNPCLRVRPCATNAQCEVKNELPFRVMVCTCKPGYTGKGDERCDLIRESI